MNNPNETPNFGMEAIPMLVGWGSQMLPGAVFCKQELNIIYPSRTTKVVLTLDRPSMRITIMRITEDTIPSIDVMESHESGKNTAGKNLESGCQYYALSNEASWAHTIKPRIL